MKQAINQVSVSIAGVVLCFGQLVEAQSLEQPTVDARNWVNLTEIPETEPMRVFTDHAAIFGLTGKDSMRLSEVEKDPLGHTHYKFRQYHNGVKVEHGEFIIHQRPDGKLHLANGALYRGQAINTVPTISESHAIRTALEQVPARVYFWEVDFWERSLKEHSGNEHATYYPQPELVLTPARAEHIHTGGELYLAYKMEVRAHIPMDERVLYIDAQSGNVIREIQLSSDLCTAAYPITNYYGTRTIFTTQNAGQWRLFNDCMPGGGNLHIRDWGGSGTQVPPPTPLEITSANNTWTSTTQIFGASTQWALKRVDEYFNTIHGRSSYDDSSGVMDVYINAIYLDNNNQPYSSNAAYHGNGVMTVGIGNPDYQFPDPACISADPLEDALNTVDIMAHEYGHAIDGAEANLTYQDQSGALDESFADIYGCMVELHALGTNDWLIGDDRCTGAIRNMADPKDKGDPDTFGGINWAPTGAGQPDNGGVHTNSGVQNYWFYLLSAGGSGTNDNGWVYNVSGLGTAAAMQIAYRNHTTYLLSSSNYTDARLGAIQAAGDLFGECSFEQIQTANAWHAVGVGDNWLINANYYDPIPSDYYYVVNTLASPGNQPTATVNSTTGSIRFRAGSNIILGPGFHATAAPGVIFDAEIRDCSSFPVFSN